VSIALSHTEHRASDHVAQPWAIRSTMLAVANLDRSVAFYRELGPFDEIAREDAVAVLGHVSPASILLILRESRGSHHVRHGQQSLGLRSVTFNVGSLGELDRIESVLRSRDRFTSRQQIGDNASELLRGRDPDNSPLVFVCYPRDEPLGQEYFRTIAHMVYSLDV
jgi:catechol 2,3-dioxygenase-like lactoylglutathione lyase family enzyme